MQASSSAVLLSTAYAAPLSWMKAAINASEIYIEAFETYPRQTYRNRCRIISANGILQLSIPVNKVHGHGTITKDIEIAYDEPWQRTHYRSIDAAYSNSPFFLYYIDELLPFFEKKFRFLLDFNTMLSKAIFKLIGITTEIKLTGSFYHDPEHMHDLRQAFTPKSAPEQKTAIVYHQVFEERHGFIPDLSILDLLFNEGPAARELLSSQ
ncbi:MAG: WbqC family protein [Bacteroidales bacterium]|nr:WbqC family protein [Bacteroidales bacterium]